MTKRSANSTLHTLPAVPPSEPVTPCHGAGTPFHRGWFWIAGAPSAFTTFLQEELLAYGVVRTGSLAEAARAVRADPERWAGIVAVSGAHDAVRLAELRRWYPGTLTLAFEANPQAEFLRPDERARVLSFARRALAQAFVPDPDVACIVEELARAAELTAREVQLLCFSIGDEPRARVRKRLGISDNTLKTQVRGLLSKAGQPNLDTLATNVLREALLLKRRTRSPSELCSRAG